MNRMMAAVVLMVLLVLFMLAGAFPSPGGTAAMIFKTPVFIGLASLLAGLLVYCAWKGEFGFRRVWFLLTHLGVVVIIVGALIGWGFGQSHDFILPIGSGEFVRAIQQQDGTSVPLPFGMTCQRFMVDYYDPAYDLYEPIQRDGNHEYRKVATHKMSAAGELNLDRLGRLGRAELFNPETGEWKDQAVLTNGWILQQVPPTPRFFAAELAFQVDGEPVREQKLAVNQPVGIKGWRFYLMSYDNAAQTYVVLKARRDPGRLAVVAGIWMAIAGILMLGLLWLGGKKGAS